MLKEIPFDVEIAKKIISREIDGKISTTEGDPVVIYDFNHKIPACDVPFILGKIYFNNGREELSTWTQEVENSDECLKIEIEKPYEQILKEDFAELHKEIVQKIIDFCQKYHIEPTTAVLEINNLNNSIDEGVWTVDTHSSFKLYKSNNDCENELICFNN